jgi:hypothetical protein
MHYAIPVLRRLQHPQNIDQESVAIVILIDQSLYHRPISFLKVGVNFMKPYNTNTLRRISIEGAL